MTASGGSGFDAAATIERLRRGAGMTQAELARRAGTSQPAVARYEAGAAAPSWSTLTRLVAALGYELRVEVEPTVDLHDVRLAEELLALAPADRLSTLARYAALRAAAGASP